MDEESFMHRQETPFDNIESALEYVSHLKGACQDAQEQVSIEIARMTEPHLARKREAFQLVNYKLERLSSHIGKSEHLLKDLRKLRRLILEERKHRAKSATA